VSVTGTHEQAGDRDVFSVTLDTAGTLDIDLTTLAGGDMYLRLYGSTGQLVAENDDSGGTLNSALTRSVAAGTYYISAGTYQDQGVGGYRLDVAFQVAPPAQSFSFSTAVAGTLTSSDGARLSADDSDIVQAALAADGRVTYTLAFDGSDVGLTTDAEDLDAFAVLADGSLIVSTVGAASVPGPNGTTLSAAAEDLLQFRPTALGDNTAGTWSLYFDGSDVGLTLASENIDAVSVLSDGRLVISTTGSVAVTGVSSGVKEDLLAFRPTTLGANTAGTWAMYFDGSDVGLSGTSENVDAANVASDGTIHLSTNGPFSVPGLSGRASDVFAFRPTSTGDQTAGTYPSTFTFPGAQLGLTSLNIDGFHVGRLPSPAGPGATSGYQLVVRFTDSNVTASQRQIFQQAADRWSQIIVGDVPNVVVDGLAVDDVVIDASAPQIDGEGGILGQAGPTYFRPTTYLPSRGVMEFDAADLASLEADGSLLWVVLHEMGHVLGIGTIWENLGLVRTTATGMDYVGTHAVAAYNQLFGTTGTVVPVETDGGSGTAGGHWDEASFDNELMTGYLNGNRANPLSRITVGTLQDMGYQVNYAAADAYTPPARKRVVARGGDAHGLPAALVAADPQPALSAAPGPVARNVDHVFAWYASSRDAWSRADAPLDRFVVPASAVNPARSPAWSRPALPTRALPTAAEATDPAWLDLDPLLAELVGEIQGAV
jgi:hypothetical protein